VSILLVTAVNVFAIVPVKGLDVSKERLSSVLSPEKRKALTVAMLEDVLCALNHSKIAEVLVVSPDANVQPIAGKFKFSFLSPKNTALNASLNEAIDWCLQKNADAVLILPADIPLVSPADIDELMELGSEKSTIVMSPSLYGGTNALLLHPPKVIPVCFGLGSFFKHVKEAIVKKVEIKFHSSREIALDIDSEEELNKLIEYADELDSKKVFAQVRQLQDNKNIQA
jgi:2-phospho-L-lactate guanylyltransferase